MFSPVKFFSIFCPCPETLQENEIKGSCLINLAKEISRYSNVQALVWVLLAIFIQVHSGNKERITEVNDVKVD